MALCNACKGKGYQEGGETCSQCYGSGHVNWWETEEYQRTGKMPEEKIDPDKGFADIGLAGGAIVGLVLYLITHNFDAAIIVGFIAAFLLATILKFISKYIITFLVIGYILYLLFG